MPRKKQKVKQKKLSNHEIGARIRKEVEFNIRAYNSKFKVGEFVRQKYLTGSVGLIMESVKAHKKYYLTTVSHLQAPAGYIADRYYRYTVKILWMDHIDVANQAMDQIIDMDVRNLIPKKEKKVLETK